MKYQERMHKRIDDKIREHAAQPSSPSDSGSQRQDGESVSRCGNCYPRIKVTNPGIAGGHVEVEYVELCNLHASTSDLYATLTKARREFDFVKTGVKGAALLAEMDAAIAKAETKV